MEFVILLPTYSYKSFLTILLLYYLMAVSCKAKLIHVAIYTRHMIQDYFLQKEARVCVSNVFVTEDSKFKWCFFLWKMSK